MQKNKKKKERDAAQADAALESMARVSEATGEKPPAGAQESASNIAKPGENVGNGGNSGGTAFLLAAEHEDPQDSHQAMLGSAAVVSVMTLISRLTGLWRFRVMGQFFGASGVADAFNFAFIFPNLTRRLFGEGLLTSVFVPVFSDRLAKGQKEAANRTASILLIRLSYWLSFGCIAIIGISMGIRFAGLAAALGMSELDLKLFEALLPYCVVINVAAVLMAILNSLRHFWMPAFAPVLLNLLVIAACYFGLPMMGTLPEKQIWAVAIAVLIGGAVQLIVQIPPALASGFRFSATIDSADPGYREVMDNFKPVALMVAVFQLNVLMDNWIAKRFIPGAGPVTYMNMGTSVYQLAWSIIALAIGVAALPILSRQWAKNKTKEFRSTLTTALRYAVFMSLPCAVGAMLLSDDIVRFLYGTGKFLLNDAQPGGGPIQRTGGVVFYSCLGLVFYSINSILVRALYAMKDMKTPTRTLFHSVALNLGLNLFFVLACPKIVLALKPYVASWASDPGKQTVSNDFFNLVGGLGNLREGGIVLASTISSAWQTWALAKAVRARLGGDYQPALTKEFSMTVFGTTAICALIGLAVYRHFAADKDAETLYAFGAGAAVFLAPSIWIGYEWCMKQFKDLRKNLRLRDDEPLPDSEVPDSLKFQHAIFTSLAATLVMGLLVWAVRDSVPPEGRTRLQIWQRALAPVAAGILVYSVASSALMSREYEELIALIKAKFGRKK